SRRGNVKTNIWALMQETAWNLETRLIDFVLRDGYLFGIIPRDECCAVANQIRLFGEGDGLLGFATLQEPFNAPGKAGSEPHSAGIVCRDGCPSRLRWFTSKYGDCCFTATSGGAAPGILR